MKIILIISGIAALLFIISQLYFMNSQKNIETYSYNVLETYDDIEIRHYEASLFTSVQLSTNNFRKTSSQGFSVLAGYIFGGNDKKERIAMTSPVVMLLKDSTTMMFLVSRKYSQEELPIPNDSSIAFKNMPAKKVAAVSFGGWANDAKIESYKIMLMKALENKGIPYTDTFYFLGYNAPMEVFNRRNEIIVELE